VSLRLPLNVAMMSLFFRCLPLLSRCFFCGRVEQNINFFSVLQAIWHRMGARSPRKQRNRQSITRKAHEAVWLQIRCKCSQTREREGLT